MSSNEQHTSDTQVVGNTNTTTCAIDVDKIISQLKIIEANYTLNPDYEAPRVTQLNRETGRPYQPLTLNITKEENIPRPIKEVDCTGIRSRSWLLTINNFTQKDIDTLMSEKTEYKVWQYEVGKKQTLHLHALLYFKNARVWPKDRYPRARIEVPRDLQDVIKYCKKDRTRVEGPWEFGQCPQQGRRTDLEAVALKVKNGMEFTQLADENPSEYIRYFRGLKELKSLQYTHRKKDNPPKVIWRFGESGTGKTRGVFDLFDEDDIYIKDNTQWWDGYTQQKVILMDEYDHTGYYKFRNLLILTDRFKCQGQFKGGFIPINSEWIFITSEFSPLELFNGTDNECKQIKRRLLRLEELSLDSDDNTVIKYWIDKDKNIDITNEFGRSISVER